LASLGLQVKLRHFIDEVENDIKVRAMIGYPDGKKTLYEEMSLTNR